MIPKRALLIFGTFLLSVLLYVDRACIATAKDSITSDLNLSDTQWGWVMSAFALGYAFFQTPTGAIADRFGPRILLSSVVVLWSIFTGLTGMARGFFSLFAVRFLFGAGEAGAFPGMARAVFSWIPMSERGLAQSINFSGSRLGAAFAMPLVTWLLVTTGWRNMFLILMGVGFVWTVLWYLWFRDEPTQHTSISDTEKNYILENRQPVDASQKQHVPFSLMARSPNMWMAMVQYFCSNFTFFFALSWLFPHLKKTYGLDTMETGLYTSAPFIGGAVGSLFAGWMIDRIYKKGQWQLSRRLPAMIGFSLAAIGLLMSLAMESPLGAVMWFTVAIFGADMTLSPSWSFCTDIGRKNAGAVSGTMNMAGNIGSMLTGLAFPYLLVWTGSTTPFFFVAAGLNVLAIILWSQMKPDKPLELEVAN
ncbi:MAG: MFS transporter [Verrucomicrobia bacterium]|jgi:MFS transporter, ACS family, glucarate transporter|nr:MFS transporter [Verrucomicrobiota bacterium]